MSIFISYSHEDKLLFDELLTHLRPYKRDDEIEVWTDEDIRPGDLWREEIENALARASVGVFLVSDHFLNSSFIMDIELPKLLQRANDEKISILWLAVDASRSNHILTPYQALTTPSRELRQMSAAKRGKALVDIAGKIVEAEIKHSGPSSVGPGPRPFGNGTQSIHIFTSVKGGVGKTLLSGAVVASYVYRNLGTGNGKVLAVDLNTMNIDLYNMLRNPQNETQRAAWRSSLIDQNTNSYVIRRSVPYILPMGVSGFWEGIKELIEQYPNYDLVVDTNMHVANLGLGPQNAHPEQIISRILTDAQRKIYIWILWTFASFRDPEYVKEGIRSLQDRLTRSVPDVQKRIKYVHVLNPSALVAPQSDLSRELELIVATRQRFDDLIRHLSDIFPNGLNQSQLVEMKRNVLQKILEESDWFDSDDSTNPDNHTPLYYFPGLRPLMNDANPAPDGISPDELIEQVGNLIVEYAGKNRLSDILTEIYNTSFKQTGRPWNLLPLYVYDSKLQGFTENEKFYTGGDIYKLHRNLGELQQIMERFLLILLRSGTVVKN